MDFSTMKICFHQFGVQQRAARGAVKFLKQIVTYQLAHERTGVRWWKGPWRAPLLPALSEFAKHPRAFATTNPLGAGIRHDLHILAKGMAHSDSLSSPSPSAFLSSCVAAKSTLPPASSMTAP